MQYSILLISCYIPGHCKIKSIYTLAQRFYPGNVKPPSMQDLVRFKQIIDVTTQEKAAIPLCRSLAPYHPNRCTAVVPYNPNSVNNVFTQCQLSSNSSTTTNTYGNAMSMKFPSIRISEESNHKLNGILQRNSKDISFKPTNNHFNTDNWLTVDKEQSLLNLFVVLSTMQTNITTIPTNINVDLSLKVKSFLKHLGIKDNDKKVLIDDIDLYIQRLNDHRISLSHELTWNNNKQTLLNELQSFFDNYPITIKDVILPLSRDRDEYNQLYSDNEEIHYSWEHEIKKFLSLEKKTIFRVPSQYEYNISLEKKHISLLTNYSQSIYDYNEKVWHEFIRRAGITTNVDASATRQEVLDIINDNAPYGYPVIEGQGSKVVAQTYAIMNKDSIRYFEPAYVQLSENERDFLLKRVMNEDLIVGIIFRKAKEIQSLPYLSGDDLHCLAVLPFKNGYIAFATLTSTNDSFTYKFGDIQYANKNIQERGKAEYCRPLSHLIYFDETQASFIELPEHTALLKTGFYKQTSVKDIFVQAIRDYYPMWKENFIRKPISFTPETITKLAITMCNDRLNSLEKSSEQLKRELRWDSLSQKQKDEEILKRSKHQENDLIIKQKSTYRKMLPEGIKNLFDYKEQLLLKNKRHQEKLKKENERGQQQVYKKQNLK